MTKTSIEKELENYKTALKHTHMEKWQKLHFYLNSLLELDCDNNECIEDDDKLIELVKNKLAKSHNNGKLLSDWQKLFSCLHLVLGSKNHDDWSYDTDQLIEAVKEKFSTPKTKQASKFEINEYAIYDGNKMRRKDYTALMSSPPQYRFYTNDNKVYTIRGTEMLQIAESK